MLLLSLICRRKRDFKISGRWQFCRTNFHRPSVMGQRAHPLLSVGIYSSCGSYNGSCSLMFLQQITPFPLFLDRFDISDCIMSHHHFHITVLIQLSLPETNRYVFAEALSISNSVLFPFFSFRDCIVCIFSSTHNTRMSSTKLKGSGIKLFISLLIRNHLLSDWRWAR